MMKMMKVTPRMTGIICSNRRTMYLPIRHSSREPTSVLGGQLAVAALTMWDAAAASAQHSVGPPGWDRAGRHIRQSLMTHRVTRRNRHRHLTSRTTAHLTLMELRSIVPNGVILTSVTRSDQPKVLE